MLERALSEPPKVWADCNLRSVRWVLGEGGAWRAVPEFGGAREVKEGIVVSLIGEVDIVRRFDRTKPVSHYPHMNYTTTIGRDICSLTNALN